MPRSKTVLRLAGRFYQDRLLLRTTLAGRHIWTVIMALAALSPAEGTLLARDGSPYSFEDILAEAGIPVRDAAIAAQEMDAALRVFLEWGMLEVIAVGNDQTAYRVDPAIYERMAGKRPSDRTDRARERKARSLAMAAERTREILAAEESVMAGARDIPADTTQNPDMPAAPTASPGVADAPPASLAPPGSALAGAAEFISRALTEALEAAVKEGKVAGAPLQAAAIYTGVAKRIAANWLRDPESVHRVVVVWIGLKRTGSIAVVHEEGPDGYPAPTLDTALTFSIDIGLHRVYDLYDYGSTVLQEVNADEADAMLQNSPDAWSALYSEAAAGTGQQIRMAISDRWQEAHGADQTALLLVGGPGADALAQHLNGVVPGTVAVVNHPALKGEARSNI